MKPFRKKKTIAWSIGIIILVAALIASNVLALGVYDNAITTYVGAITIKGSGDGEYDANYYTALTSPEDATQHAKDVNLALCEEGIVLLKNDGGLPFAKGTTFSLFSHSSVDFVYSTTGSGSTNAGENAKETLKDVLTQNGMKVNEALWKFYSTGNGSGTQYTRGKGSIIFGRSEQFYNNEVPISKITSEAGLTDTFKGTKAVFVLSRVCGEGRDLSRSMINNATSADNATVLPEDYDKSYLEPDSVELGVISYLQENSDFDEIILIVNSNNAVELGWTEDYSKIKTILHVPGTGSNGLGAVAEILNGTVTPSGHTVDTFVYNAFSSPAASNMEESVFVKNGDWSANPTYPTNAAVAFGENSLLNYVMYQEGIYVGYRYYETRYEDCILGNGNADSSVGSTDGGAWDYAKEVKYPFGYGLSTTTFEWSNYKTSWSGKECTVSVTVKNTGSRSGKEVVQVYAQSPYTDYDKENGIEKSSVQLVGFVKTSLLEPGKSETVKVTFDEEYLKSYDANNAKTYILDAGTYYITAAKDAHAAINNIIMAKDPSKASKLIASPSEEVAGDATLVDTYEPKNNTVDTTTYSKDTTTGVEITNLFDDCQRYDDPTTANDESITFLSRSAWDTTYPVDPYGEVDYHLGSAYGNRINGTDGKSYVYSTPCTEEEYERLKSIDSLNPEQFENDASNDVVLQFNQDNGLTFSDMRGKAYDDPAWALFLAQISEDDFNNLIRLNQSYPEAESLGKATTLHSGGPLGFVNSKVGYNSEPMTGQTWNVELATLFGQSIANDMICNNNGGRVSIGAPGVNIHRTPFLGRSAEYYSEDPVLNGLMAANVIHAASEMGVIVKVKHFALNEIENNRGDGGDACKWGIATFATEQTIRELYLKAFELAIKEAGTVTRKSYQRNYWGEMELVEEEVPAANGVMTSFNRIGYTWAGGCYPLITGVLRNEWGFDGHIVTDFEHGGNMNTIQMLYAGGDSKLANQVKPDYDGSVDYFDIKTADANIAYYALEGLHHVLYTEVNSFATNGLLPGDTSTVIPIHHIIMIGLNALYAAGIIILGVLLTKELLKLKKKS